MGFEVGARTAPRDLDAMQAWWQALVSTSVPGRTPTTGTRHATGTAIARLLAVMAPATRRAGRRRRWSRSAFDRGTRASRPRECSRATVVGRRGQPSRSPCGLWPRVQRVAPQGRPLPAVREFPPPQRRGPQPRGQPIARKGRHGGGLKVAGFDAHGSAVLCGVSSVRPRSFAACRGLTSGSLRLPPRERSVIQPPAVDPV
jgi:hypothetical protein